MEILVAIIFYFIGRYSNKDDRETLKEIKRKLKRNKVKSGVIEFKSPQELEYIGSEQEKIDKEWEENMKKSGLLPE
jgi:hypothetical protein